MDIQIQSTPPKRMPNRQELCTPPKKSTAFDAYNTPNKKTPIKDLSPFHCDRTPKRGQNPESKKLRSFGTHKKTPGSSNRKVSEFSISRLERDYIFERTIGEGNFSSVGLYRSRMTGDMFAIKTTRASQMSVNEAQALGTLSIFNQKSKNIIRYYHSWVENSELHLVMEYCTHNLSTVYDKHRKCQKQFEQGEIKDIFKQILQGLKCMHQNKMVHLDVKPDNLLFRDSILKISDLGLTRITKIRRIGDLEEGDSRYLAKELLNYEPSIDLTKADIFSLGMAIYEGLSLQNLPNNGEEWQFTREHGLHLKDRMDLQQYSQQMLEIVEKMTHPNWSVRPSAAQILQMNYFKQSLTRRSRILMQGHHLQSEKNKKKQSSV